MKPETVGRNICIADGVSFGKNVVVGHASCVGGGRNSRLAPATTIGDNVSIGAFCYIAKGVQIGEEVKIGHYCLIGENTKIGKGSRILDKAQIFADVLIGEYCIIAGSVADRTVIENYVTFLGVISHSHREPTNTEQWDNVEEDSPIIRYGSVIGENAMVIGGITIGPQSYIAAGEIVRFDVPPKMVLYKGNLSPLSAWHGVIKVRGESTHE